MKKITAFLRSALAVRYRVAVIVRGRCFNASGTDRRKLISLAQRTEDMSFWTLYKSGPFGLPEREIDCYMKGDVQ